MAADPTTIAGADRPGGWPGIVYYRLHGSRSKYWSAYEHGFLERIADAMSRVPALTRPGASSTTRQGAALENACSLQMFGGKEERRKDSPDGNAEYAAEHHR